MKRKLLVTLLTLTLLTTLVGCGDGVSSKDVGHQDILEQVENGEYVAPPTADEIASDTDVSSETIVTNEMGWVIESANLEECDESIKALVKDVSTEYAPYLYVGYTVEDNTIKYAFSGFKGDQKCAIFVIQSTDNKLTYEYDDYSEIFEILAPAGPTNEFEPTPADPSTLITEPGWEPGQNNSENNVEDTSDNDALEENSEETTEEDTENSEVEENESEDTELSEETEDSSEETTENSEDETERVGDTKNVNKRNN